MVPELEVDYLKNINKPRVTEIQVRMDCNGCVQKIKKALHGINGIYDIYIDFPQQRLTVIGWADPEKIVKAIRKTRKIAIICSHSEASSDPAAQTPEQPQQPPEGSGGAPTPPAPKATTEALPVEAAAATTPPAETPKDPPPPENPPPSEEKPSPSTVAVDANANANRAAQPSALKDVGEVHVIYHHPPDYGYRYGHGHNYGAYGGHWNRYPVAPSGRGCPPEPPPPQQAVHVTHSYNTYRPSPYVTEYQYIQPLPRHDPYSIRTDHYSEDYHDSNRNGNITSIFSDENPNACTIM